MDPIQLLNYKNFMRVLKKSIVQHLRKQNLGFAIQIGQLFDKVVRFEND